MEKIRKHLAVICLWALLISLLFPVSEMQVNAASTTIGKYYVTARRLSAFKGASVNSGKIGGFISGDVLNVVSISQNGWYRVKHTYKGKTTYYYVDSQGGYFVPNSSFKLAKVTLNSVSASKKGLTVKWGQVKNATGYEIYSSTGSSYKRVATVSGNKASWLDKNTILNKTYKYKVRAYTNTNSGKKYGNYSSVRTGKRTQIGLYDDFFHKLNDQNAVSKAKQLATLIGGLKSSSNSSFRNVYRTGKGIVIGANSPANASFPRELFYFKNTSNKNVYVYDVTIGNSFSTVKSKLCSTYGMRMYSGSGGYYYFNSWGEASIKTKFVDGKLTRIEYSFGYTG